MNADLQRPGERVVRIAADQLAAANCVAQLAVTLCGLKKEERDRSPTPASYLDEAYELLVKACETVTRPLTDVEYLVTHGKEALADVLGSLSNSIPFKKVSDPERPKGDSEPMHGIMWRVYRGKEAERQFKKLFWAYWDQVGKNWQRGGTPEIRKDYSKAEIVNRAKLARNRKEWHSKGSEMLSGWKQFGIAEADFLALANFRKMRNRVRQGNLRIKKGRVADRTVSTPRPRGSARRSHRK